LAASRSAAAAASSSVSSPNRSRSSSPSCTSGQLKQFLHRKSHLQWDLEFILIEGCSSSVLTNFLTVTTH
jgi:hypothetical protein